ncbi:MAG: nucleoside phosphorylase [Crocinitomicaceae bacterium]|nr:nucleoside phosphorylase [Crocinitomicaceae bacterium]
MIPESELILNTKGNVYHLDLAPEQIADDVIIVGDPDRVKMVSSFFDSVEFENHNREFFSSTGLFNGKRITVISSGIGTDNIDILLNELDALKNIDLKTREIKSELSSLNIVRIGTSGSLRREIQPGDVVVSSYAIGIDGLLNFYDLDKNDEPNQHLKENLEWHPEFNRPYMVKGSQKLIDQLSRGYQQGITVTANGFYAPQGREIRLKNRKSNFLDALKSYSYQQIPVTNLEMETSGLYGLSKLLGHEACTVCLILAGRTSHKFQVDYHGKMKDLIQEILIRLTSGY